MTMKIENLHEIPNGLYNAVLSQVQAVQNGIMVRSDDMYKRGDTLVTAAQSALRDIVSSLVDPIAPPDPTPTTVSGPGAFVPTPLPTMGAINVPVMPTLPAYVSQLADLDIPDVVIPAPPAGNPVVALPA